MKLAELMLPWIKSVSDDCDILGLHNDSRQIKEGFLFIAYPGAAADGRFFCTQASKAGASAIIYEPENWPENCELPSQTLNLPLPGLAKKLAAIASRFYNEPSKKLSLTGITGTNGKTTIAYQLAQAHDLLDNKAAYIGTLGEGEVSALNPLANTTPDGLHLQQLFALYQQEGIKQVCMEVSSHALSQQRVDNIHFQQAIFTNLSHDHLDYHQTMEAYAAAKALLFAKPGLDWAIINYDDPAKNLMINAVQAPCKILSYGLQEGADICALSWEVSLAGTQLRLRSPWGEHQILIKALGFFNIYNALAIFTSLMACGYPIDKVIPIMATLNASPGRMEVVHKEPYIIVDYAHTPDALENVLKTLEKMKTGRILTVFGCGGDRDKSKRPMMGKIASQYADIAIITSDNPRTENPLSIINEIEAGASLADNLYKIPERKEAIIKAIELANKNDIILVAGKGHEDYQQIGTVRYPFSDQEVIRALLKHWHQS